MFSGIIQGTAKIISVNKKTNFRTHIVELPDYMLSNLEIGASVANNGCCLTVTNIKDNHISFDLIKETLCITNLGKLVPGDSVNIERAVKFSDEIGGHMMSGHISTTAKIEKIFSLKYSRNIWFKPRNLSLMKYIFHKGFIGVDGISLTVGEVTNTCFCVNLIPQTLQHTTIGMKKLCQDVNIEIDQQTRVMVDTIEKVFYRNFNPNSLHRETLKKS